MTRSHSIVGTLTITADDLAVVEGDAWLSQQIRDEHRLDVRSARLLTDLVRPLIPIGGTVADIGACLGDHTISYADAVGPRGHVYAFEPHPVTFEGLCYNLRMRPWVTCHAVALADHVGRCVVGLDPICEDNLGMATIHRASDEGPVVMTTLDQIAADWDRLDFVKLDIEGVEASCLDGAVQTLTRWHPPLLIEVNRRALAQHGATPFDVFQRLDRLGYVCLPICYTGGTTDPLVRIGEDELDVVCLPRDHAMAGGFLTLT